MIYLLIGVVIESIGATLLGKADAFTKFWPSIGALVCVFIGIWCWSLSVKTLDIGSSYAIWAGLGIVLTGISGWLFFKQTPDWPAFAGFALIIAGVIVIDLFSKTVRG